MTPEKRAEDFLTSNLPTMEGYCPLVEAFRAAELAATAAERERIAVALRSAWDRSDDQRDFVFYADAILKELRVFHECRPRPGVAVPL